MVHYFNTKPKVNIKKIAINNKEVAIDNKKLDNDEDIINNKEIVVNKGTSVKNAIFLKIGSNKISEFDNEKVLLDKKLIQHEWNINCGIPRGKIPKIPNIIIYENKKPSSKIVFISTFGIKCGIATYTSHLLNNINKLYGNEISDIFPVNNRNDIYKIDSDIVHIQHEYGIISNNFETTSKVIITFHTLHKNPKGTLSELEGKFRIIAYVAHSEEIKNLLTKNTKKDVYLIPHGSEIINVKNTKSELRKELNFDKLGIGNNDICAFTFGFQSANKDYNILINACKNMNVRLIISGAKHESLYENVIKGGNKNIILLNRHLDDLEINKFSSACNLLIFNCIKENYYSCSGALHRVISSGNPVICSRVNHFNDINENINCLKYSDQQELELKIKEALEKVNEFSLKSTQYANNSSWESVAKLHLDMYDKYTDIYNAKSTTTNYENKVVFISSDGTKCGIAVYTNDLIESLKEKIDVDRCSIKSSYGITAKLVHFQHEFGIMPTFQKVLGKSIITWHSVGNFDGNNNIIKNIKRIENINNVVAHIVTCEGAKSFIETKKDVYVVSLGSKLMNHIAKEEARKILNLNIIKIPIGLIFGFQSANKNYDRLIKAAENTNIHLIICSSVHSCGYNVNLSNKNIENITFIDKYLTDEEIDLYAQSSDILLFDYVSQNHYSSSSAMHRLVGAGRPVVCHNTNHFNDIRHELDGALKYKTDEELEKYILEALKRSEELGNKVLEYAKRTSRENVAKKHIEIYSKYVTL